MLKLALQMLAEGGPQPLLESLPSLLKGAAGTLQLPEAAVDSVGWIVDFIQKDLPRSPRAAFDAGNLNSLFTALK